MNKHVTLKQLATELNLSVSTVSKALKNSYEINEKTIAKVQALAKKYNYRPNRMALSLKISQTKTIGVVIPNILNYFLSKVLLGIEAEANRQGYQLLICLSNNHYEKEMHSLQLLSDGSVDGFILSVAKETQMQKKDDHFKKIVDEGYPIVMFDRVSEQIDCDKVIIDDLEAAYDATTFLLNQGCKKIALISSINDIHIGKLRIQGYQKALSDNKEYSNKEIVVSIQNKNDFTREIAKLFETNKDIDGIFTTDNVSAVTAMNLAHKLGYKIPEDLAVIGFSDDKVSRLAYPALTTVSQSAQEMGIAAAAMLIDRLKNPNSKDYKTRVIKTGLVIREST
ncbi:MAG: LacI family DNA-binding transcriptional regulator [Flavobacteriaceae bacterium]|nr:LacI family DNA-binding transcriptional regulator [Flavobacteriaceae bacterium]